MTLSTLSSHSLVWFECDDFENFETFSKTLYNLNDIILLKTKYGPIFFSSCPPIDFLFIDYFQKLHKRATKKSYKSILGQEQTGNLFSLYLWLCSLHVCLFARL